MKSTHTKTKIGIIGAGPGGLSTAMILAHRGYDVTVFEKKPVIGGRNAALKAEGYTFEIGPTFVMLPQVFEEIFMLSGRSMKDYLDLRRLDPMYRLNYADGRTFDVHFDKDKLKQEIGRLFPGEEKGFDEFMKSQKKKYDHVYACLKVPYMRIYNFLRWRMFRALPYVDVTVSVHDVLSRYFKHEDLKIAMAFQAKYLGMSPWHCPGLFTILSYMEHAYGIYHPMGGVHKISEAMAKSATEDGAKIITGAGIEKILFDGTRAKGLRLTNGQEHQFDAVIMNADFARGMQLLVEPEKRPKYTDEKLESKSYSCSTFMIYLGVDKIYDIPHHQVFFSSNYRKNVDEIFETRTLPDDPSFYIQNASATDPSLAPSGCSTLYILAPVPNQKGVPIDWKTHKQAFRDLILKQIKERLGVDDLESHIKVERIITPDDWEGGLDVYKGAVFSLAHSLDQLLYFRPHNRLNGYQGFYVVGGGTHPGSGLPTILESGRIAADLVSKDYPIADKS